MARFLVRQEPDGWSGHRFLTRASYVGLVAKGVFHLWKPRHLKTFGASRDGLKRPQPTWTCSVLRLHRSSGPCVSPERHGRRACCGALRWRSGYMVPLVRAFGLRLKSASFSVRPEGNTVMTFSMHHSSNRWPAQ